MTKAPAKRAGRIRIGVGGWSYPPWRETFYPKGVAQKNELAHASSVLSAIEINATFYRTQAPATFAKWHDTVPDDFSFTVKAPRYATNRKVLGEAGESIERFFASGLAELGDKLGPIFWQFAPTKRFDPDDFGAFLSLLPQTLGERPLRHALEVRHDSFRNAEFVSLARDQGVAIVWAMDAKYPEIADPTADFVYLRMMGTQKGEPLGYTQAALDARADALKAIAQGATPKSAPLVTKAPKRQARDVFAFVISGHKEVNPAAAQALLERTR